jgi:phosphoenolpyruvate carboxylase
MFCRRLREFWVAARVMRVWIGRLDGAVRYGFEISVGWYDLVVCRLLEVGFTGDDGDCGDGAALLV